MDDDSLDWQVDSLGQRAGGDDDLEAPLPKVALNCLLDYVGHPTMVNGDAELQLLRELVVLAQPVRTN
jgi:hypothetical protein